MVVDFVIVVKIGGDQLVFLLQCVDALHSLAECGCDDVERNK